MRRVPNTSFVRDDKTKAFINTEGYDEFKRKRSDAERLNKLETDMRDIKQMLQVLIKRG